MGTELLVVLLTPRGFVVVVGVDAEVVAVVENASVGCCGGKR